MKIRKKDLSILVNSIIIVVSLFSIIKIQYSLEVNKEKSFNVIGYDEVYSGIRKIGNLIPNNKVLMVDNFPWYEENAVVYFLRNRKISLQNSNGYIGRSFENPSDGSSSYYLKTELTYKSNDIYSQDGLKWQNDRLSLYNSAMKIQLGKGFYNYEGEPGKGWRWIDKDAEFKVEVEKDKTVSLEFQISMIVPISNTSYKDGEVYLNNSLIGNFKAEKDKINNISIDNIMLKEGQQNEFKIVIVDGANKVSFPDNRNLSVAFTKIEIVDKK